MNGIWAESGNVNEVLLKAMLEDPYFQLSPPKSTGRDYFNLEWLNKLLELQHSSIPPENIQATLLELTVTTISEAIKKYAEKTDEILVCGGGVHNPVLIKSLEEKLPGIKINSTGKYGFDPDCIEAVAFAWLAKCRLDETPVNLSSVTGAISPQILGAIYSAQK